LLPHRFPLASSRGAAAWLGASLLLLATIAAPGCSESPSTSSFSLHHANQLVLACLDPTERQGVPLSRCELDGVGHLYAYVSSAARGELAVLRLTARDAGGTPTDSVELLDASRQVPGKTHIRVGDGPGRLRLGPDGRQIFVLNDASRDISVVDVGRSCEVARIPWGDDLPATAAAADLLPDQAWLAPYEMPGKWDGTPPARGLLLSFPALGEIRRVDLDACAIAADAPCVAPGAEPAVAQCSATPFVQLDLGAVAPGLVASPSWLAWGERPSDAAEPRTLLVADATYDMVLRVAPEQGTVVQVLSLSPACGDGLDNDGDGATDLDDPGCSWAGDTGEGGGNVEPQCSDGRDNDGDGRTDLDDPGCKAGGDPREAGPNLVPACANGLDDDGDGLVDHEDPGCAGEWDRDERDPPDVAPACADGVDNDGDGDTDLDDLDCAAAGGTSEANRSDAAGDPILPACADGVDNDGDGATDFPADPGCHHPGDRSEWTPAGPCWDGIDNDGDGLVDLADPGCSSAADPDEGQAPPSRQCSDGVDNDGDGLVDAKDPDCEDAEDLSEFPQGLIQRSTPACADGVDNDGDGATDYPDDPGCAAAGDEEEDDAVPSPPRGDGAPSTCNNGLDDDGDGRIDGEDRGCTSAWGAEGPDPAEVPACADGLDNDGDGLVDRDDPGCAAAGDPDEADSVLGTPACANGRDDDGDGLADYPDAPACWGRGWAFEEAPRVLPTCANGLDDDGDGLRDQDDPDCPLAGIDGERTRLPSCDDQRDNDGDGLVDAADPDCRAGRAEGSPAPSPGGTCANLAEWCGDAGAQGAVELPRCSNGRDDDGDGLIDAEDPGCAGPQDNRELDEGELLPCATDATLSGDCVYSGGTGGGELLPGACSNGIDDDGDGRVDADDPGCQRSTAEGEPDSEWDGPRVTQCSDGRANEVPAGHEARYQVPAGRIDLTSPGCYDADDDLEAQRSLLPDCSNGADDDGADGDGLADLLDPGCFGPGDDDEDDGSLLPSCSDGLDNDGDGDVDAADSDCSSAGGREGAWRSAGLASLALTPDGRFLYATHRWQRSALVFDLARGRLVDTQSEALFSSSVGIPLGGLPLDLSFSCQRRDADDTLRPEACTAGSTDVLALVARSDGQVAAIQVKEAGVDRHQVRDRELKDDDRIGAVGLYDPDGNLLASASSPPVWAPAFARSSASRGGPGDYAISLTSMLGPENDYDATLGRNTLENGVCSAVWEGILPYSESTNGSFSPDEPGLLLDPEADFCRLGVEPGDRLIVLSRAPGGTSEQEQRCELLFGERALDGREGFEYCIREVTPQGLRVQAVPRDGRTAQPGLPCPEVDPRRRLVPLEAIGGTPPAPGEESPEIALATLRPLDPLPGGSPPEESCFPELLRYRVRASGHFLVYRRSDSGSVRFPHNQTSRYGQCELLRYPSPLRSSRAWVGLPFRNEAIGFTLKAAPQPRLVANLFPDQGYRGTVDSRTYRLPRGLAWRIETRSGLNPTRWAVGGVLGTVQAGPLGRAYVTDQSLQRVWEIDTSTGALRLLLD